MNHISKQKGFTLIELLVVIAIIGLLSSVVFGSVAQAKIKGRNVATEQQARQYVNAIDLYKSDHNGQIPSIPIVGGGSLIRCLGIYSGGCTLYGFISSGDDPTFDAQFTPYIPSFPNFSSDTVSLGGLIVRGGIYEVAVIGPNNTITSANILWTELNTTTCTYGSYFYGDGVNTICSYTVSTDQ